MAIPAPGRRLAVIDTHFPWKQSGLRYWEYYEIYRQRPDTLFFATDPYTDPMGNSLPNDFPAPVHHISQLGPLVISERITDISVNMTGGIEVRNWASTYNTDWRKRGNE